MNVIIKNNTNIHPRHIIPCCERMIALEKDWQTMETTFYVTDEHTKIKITCRKRKNIVFTIDI